MLKRLVKMLLPVVIVLAVFFSASAQSVRVLTTKDGLPQSFVSGLVQDDDGFLWMSTRNGLARYDGVQFKVFQHSVRDTATIASDLIIWINKDNHNNLWIEYESGAIDKLNASTEKITHISKGYVFAGIPVKFMRRGWLVDQDKALWLINDADQLIRFNLPKMQVNKYVHISNPDTRDTLMGLLNDRKNKLWILSKKGLSRFNKGNQTFTTYFPPVAQLLDGGEEKEIVDLHERENGELMWGDQKNLFFFNPANNRFRVVALPHTSGMGIRYIRTGADKIDYFEFDKDIYSYSDKYGLALVFKHDSQPMDIESLLVDRSGMIWIGTNAIGIKQLDLIAPFFQAFTYKDGFFQDLIKKEFNVSVESLFNWQQADDHFSAAGYQIRSVYDRHKRLWIGLKQTVCYYDEHLKKFIKLPEIPITSSRFKADRIAVKGLTIMPNGEPMVVCANRQIRYYNDAEQKWVSFIGDDLIADAFGASVLPLDIFNDGSTIWITTENDGLIYIDVKTKQLHQLKSQSYTGALPINQLLGFKQDPTRPGLLWIGSYQGLICFNKKTLKCSVFSTDDGLPDNTIYSIVDDNEGYLWLSTNKGLCRFQPITHKVRVFQTNYGLPGNEFNRFHGLELPDGRLAFGGPDGWTLFNPLAIKYDNYNPSVAFTNLKVNNMPVYQGQPDGLLTLPLNAVHQLDLSYEQNTLTFEFAGLQFNQPGDLLYRYRLVGYDDGWILAGHSPVANYTKIPPGNYTLKVNSSNTVGQWSNNIKTISIIIDSPWWSTWWAFLCYGLLTVFVIWRYIRYSINMGLLNHEIKLKERETEQLKKLDEVKTQFFSNITHEFRTPLTLILGPAEQLKEKYLKDKQGNHLAETITGNAQHLLQLVNQLMDLAKLEANALKVNQLWGNPEGTVNRVIQSFINDAETKCISLHFNSLLDNGSYWFASELLEQIVYNLISNATKFTLAGGQINVSIEPWQNGIKLTVSDTGIGIPEDDLLYIFDRFYQVGYVNGVRLKDINYKGTGIGLALVKELVEVQGGTVEVKSSIVLPTGSSFTVFLPGRKVEKIDVPVQNDLVPVNQLAETEFVPEILVVEDNADLSAFISASLANDYKIIQATNGIRGVEQAFEKMPDLIISDVLMDGMDGFALCDQLKDDIRTSHIPIILLTAKAEQESMMEGLKHGADDYLTKPFHVSELLLRIKNQLSRQQKLRAHIRQEFNLAGLVSEEQIVVVQDVFISRLYNIIEEHLDDSLFGVDELVNLVNMSRTSLHRKIKALSGMSTSEFIRNHRLKRAAQFLHQNFNSSDAAYKTGFNSPAYFSKCFREVYGITPVEFVRKA